MANRRMLSRPTVKLSLKVVGAAAVLLVVWLLFAKGVGEPCSSDWDCLGIGSFCLRGSADPTQVYCSRPCASRSDCPEHLLCAEVPVLPGGSYSLEMKRICTLP